MKLSLRHLLNQPNECFDAFLRFYMEKCENHNFSDMIKHVNNYPKLIPITDWLHLLKNLRSRLIHQDILLSCDLPVLEFVKLCSQFKIEKNIYKESSQLAMSDVQIPPL